MTGSANKCAATLFFAFLLFATSAVAGPPLVCHSFDIGTAKSLPWISHGWNLTGAESYKLNDLVSDTTSILDADSTVLVHMETLRRAMLYAEKDAVVAKRLLVALIARSNAAAKTPAGALASFDAGYLAETYKQYEWINKSSNDPAHNVDGYALIKKAIQLHANDPQMEFAAALITLNGPAGEHADHAQKALAAANADPLLARNLATHFMSPQSETMAEMISRNANEKVARR
jgi:hypothetical protein